MRKLIQIITIAGIIFTALDYHPRAHAAEPPSRETEIIEVEGAVDVKKPDIESWKRAKIGTQLTMGDLLRTVKKSYADMDVEKIDTKNAIIRVKGDSTIETDISPSEIILRVVNGKLVFWAKKVEGDLRKFEIRTPNAIIGIEGSLGVLKYDDQLDATSCWLKVSGGYAINIYSGSYQRLTPGANYIEVKEKDIKIQKGFNTSEFSYDLRGFQANYAFVIREAEAPSAAAEKYSKEYLSGKYKTSVEVNEGEVTIAPYDEAGPRFVEGFVLVAGQRVSVEGEIEIIEEEPRTKKEEKEEEEEPDEPDEPEEPDEDLRIKDGVDDSQKILHK